MGYSSIVPLCRTVSLTCSLSIVTRNVDLREYLSEEVQAVHKNTTYDLIANIVHDGKPSEGSYRIHVLHHVSGADFSRTEGHTAGVPWASQRAAPFRLPFLHSP